jgi:hypothetical protein
LRLIRVVLCGVVALALSACEPGITPVSNKRHAPGPQPVTPALNTATPYGSTAYDNRSLANLFVRLAHDLEWGAQRPNLVRLEAPISVGMTGCCAAEYTPFVDRFLSQFRAQTGIAIQRGTTPHNLHINLVNGAEFRSRVPAHLCVVAPGNLPWSRFRESPERFGTRSFEDRRTVSAMSVYIPDTLPPHLIRRCLIEEVTQALGLANDVNGLDDTIFNDDGVHIWPTKLDYLMLRVLYASEMRSGLNRRETRARAETILARINPQGQNAPTLPAMPVREMAEWSKQVSDAFDASRSRAQRQKSANAALSIASNRYPNGVHHCRSLRIAARLVRDDDRLKLATLSSAEQVCRRAHGPSDPRLDLIALEKARILYRLGQISQAYGISEPLEARLAAHGQSERLVALFALQAAALKAIQQPASSAAKQRLAVEWARYALGRNHAQVSRLANQ